MNQKFRINGEAVAASQEGALVIELFLNENYRFRRNVLNGKVEFMTLPGNEDVSWRPLTQEALNSIILKAERENIMEKGSPNAKIKMYVQSEEVPVFNPVSTDVLTLQNIGNNTLFVCDAVHYDKLNFNNKGYQYYLLCRDGDIEYLKQRHGTILDMSRWLVHSDFEDGFKLYKYQY